jgi:hypothetical protein
MSHSIYNSLQTAGNWIKNHKLEIGLGVATTALAVAAIAATVLTAGTAAAAFGGIGVGAMLGAGAVATGGVTIGVGAINRHFEKLEAAKAISDAEKRRNHRWYQNAVNVVGISATIALGVATPLLMYL